MFPNPETRASLSSGDPRLTVRHGDRWLGHDHLLFPDVSRFAEILTPNVCVVVHPGWYGQKYQEWNDERYVQYQIALRNEVAQAHHRGETILAWVDDAMLDSAQRMMGVDDRAPIVYMPTWEKTGNPTDLNIDLLGIHDESPVWDAILGTVARANIIGEYYQPDNPRRGCVSAVAWKFQRQSVNVSVLAHATFRNT